MTQLVSFPDASGDGEVFVSPLQVVLMRPGPTGQTAIYVTGQAEPYTVTGAINSVAAAINAAF